MIKLRKSSGEVLEVPNGFSVEFCTAEGNPATVFYKDKSGIMKVVTKGSKEANRYSSLYGVKFEETRVMPASD